MRQPVAVGTVVGADCAAVAAARRTQTARAACAASRVL